MITVSYVGSGVLLVATAWLFSADTLTAWTLAAAWAAIFFLASAGASAAYLTVSEIFPMETRALAIAFFYAIGTAIGGVTGPFLFGKMIESGEESQVAIAFFLGAAVMALGGLAEVLFGVKAEGAELEKIAKPLTAEDAEESEPGRDDGAQPRPQPESPRHREQARRYRLGPGRTSYSPGMAVSTPVTELEFTREIERIQSALSENGPLERGELGRRVGARFWGPGRFHAARREAVLSGQVRRVGRNRYGPPS